MNLDQIRKTILNAKEKRWLYQLALIEKFHLPLISFKFNIPSWPKVSSEILEAFEILFPSFLEILQQRKVSYTLHSKQISALGPEGFISLILHPKEIKEITSAFEEHAPIGRLLDLDVLAIDGYPIERSRKRKCYICNDLAINCMITRKHSPIVAREFFDQVLDSFLEERKE